MSEYLSAQVRVIYSCVYGQSTRRKPNLSSNPEYKGGPRTDRIRPIPGVEVNRIVGTRGGGGDNDTNQNAFRALGIIYFVF